MGKIVEISINEKNQLIISEFFRGKLFSSRRKKVQGLDALSLEGSTETRDGEKEFKRLAIDGVWSLTEENDLKFKIMGNHSQTFGKYIILRGDIERAGGSKIGFRIRECDTLSNLRSRTIELSGRWSADTFNRLNFKVSKLDGSNDTLCFQGSWGVNRHNELTYKYTKVSLRTKRKILRELVLKGNWLLARNKISYAVEKTQDHITFRAQVLRKKLRSSDVSIKYLTQIMYIYRGKIKKIKKILEISGRWEINKDLKVEFKVKYSGIKTRSVHFVIEKIIREKSKLVVSVASSLDKKPCFDILFKKAFKDDAEFFIALSKHARESKIMAGVRVRF